MKRALTLSLGAFALVISLSSTAQTADTSPQQQRMKACNQEAGEQQLKGDARKEFMRGCLSTKDKGAKPGPAAAAGDHPECAAKAVDKNGKPLAGAARASFMKKCVAAAKP